MTHDKTKVNVLMCTSEIVFKFKRIDVDSYHRLRTVDSNLQGQITRGRRADHVWLVNFELPEA